MYEKIKRWYDLGVWNAKKVHDAVKAGKITPEQYKEITGREYTE